ncbi:protein-arginine omega-N symmetric methyltransferase [Desmophyllum pertusum]|uniref:Protein-arginine omega-N symmetric methyltransferase n=1 Tax=Desmophyllum pertusum TaxID=174260 RepID=A0A9W9ZTL6_9CNID|nr:protein-arginine omega-N symmetric methyltransferase [Desmophyllum pertusum]
MQANSRYFQHFQAAKNCLRREKYGDALAHFVFLANVEPSSKDVLEEDFIVALRHWTEVLECHGELDKLMVCLQQALKLYPQSEIILTNTGANLLKLGLTDEAVSCFRRALYVNPRSIRAKENLENVANMLVERWHFRMLNDKKRNSAYKQAICKAIDQGHDVVLDIGSGTGILSMFAVQSGAREVYGCEMSKTMFEMGQDVLKANNMEESVHTIHKKSTEITIGQDIPERVSLIVTETVDCGLLGEGILTTVEHAWAHLLMPSPDLHNTNAKPVSKVIPGGAVVYAMAIMCDDIRNQTSIGGERMEQTSDTASSGIRDQLEPYSTECLNRLRGGFIPLSHPFKVTEYDFNNPDSFNKDRNLSFEIPAMCDGRVDAIATWFDLQLDEEITLSTGPMMIHSVGSRQFFQFTQLLVI